MEEVICSKTAFHGTGKGGGRGGRGKLFWASFWGGGGVVQYSGTNDQIMPRGEGNFTNLFNLNTVNLKVFYYGGI